MKPSSIGFAIGVLSMAISLQSAAAGVTIISSPRPFIPSVRVANRPMERPEFNRAGPFEPNRFRHDRDRARFLSRRDSGFLAPNSDIGEPSADEAIQPGRASSLSIADVGITITLPAPPLYALPAPRAFSAIGGPKILIIGKPAAPAKKMPIIIYGSRQVEANDQ
jgi:hypothetical protein